MVVFPAVPIKEIFRIVSSKFIPVIASQLKGLELESHSVMILSKAREIASTESKTRPVIG